MRKTLSLAVIFLLAVANSGVSAQGPRVDASVGATGSLPPAAPGTRASAPPWSGQTGASGDPSMTAGAIRAAAANFPACLAQLWPAAARRGISRASYRRYTAA